MREMIRATEDRFRDRCLALMSQGRPKKRSQNNDGSRKKLAAARGLFIRRVVPALAKGLRCRRVGKTPDNSTKGRNRKEKLRLYEEVVKLAAGFSGRFRRVSVKILWRSQPPPKRKKRLVTG
jgi:hypothetical protein